MSEYIRRDKAIDAIVQYLGRMKRDFKNWQCTARIILDYVPSEDVQPVRWIPCSERLPENTNTVLITHRGGVSFGWYNGRYWERGERTKHRSLKTVTAWMPLPERYQVESEE